MGARFTIAAILLCGLWGCTRASKFSIQKAPFIPPADDYVGEVWRFDSAARSVEFSPDSRHIVVGGTDGFTRVWNVESGELVSELGRHGSLVWQSPILGFLVRIIPPWDLMGASSCWNLLSVSGDVYDATFSPNGKYVLTCSCDGTTRLWEAMTGRAIRTFEKFGSACITRVAFAPDGRRAISMSGEDAYVYDVETGDMLHKYRWVPVNGLTIAADGRRVLATNGSGGTVDSEGERTWRAGLRVWNLETGEELERFEMGSGAVSTTGRYLASRQSRTVTIRDLASRKLLNVFDLGRGSGVAFSPDARRILCGVTGRDAGESFRGSPALVLLDVQSGEIICRLESASGHLADLILSPNGRLAAAIGFGDGSVRVWQLPTMDQESKTSPATAGADE